MTRIIVSRLWSSLLVFCWLLTLSPVSFAQEKQLSAEDRKSLDEVLEVSRKVVELHKANRVAEAFPLAKRVLNVRLKMLGENDPLVADAYSNLGALSVASVQYEHALDFYQHALNSYTNAAISDLRPARLLDTMTLLALVLKKSKSRVKRRKHSVA